MSELATALLFALRIGVPGWLWLRHCPDPREPTRTAGSLFARTGRVIALGLVLNLLPALCVAQSGHWTAGVDWGLWVGVVLAGLARRLGSSRGGSWLDAVCAIGFLALVTAVVLVRPPRSEWVAGGWDPGIYQNEAVVVARSAGFTDRTNSVYALLTRDERSLFGPEAFPAVPMRADTGALQHYFFQLTPMCGALTYRLGGLAALVRMNPLLAFMGLPLVFALAGALGVAGWRRGWLLVAWCVSPLWWYQQAIPTTEVLELLLVCGAAVSYLDAERRGERVPLVAALLLVAVGINHFGFPPLVAVMLVVAAAAESFAQRPGRTGRFLTCALALAVGLAWDLAFSSVTISTPQVKHRVISQLLVPFVACCAAGLWVSHRRIDLRLATGVSAVTRWGAQAVSILIAVLTVVLVCPFTGPATIRFAGQFPVAGEWLLRFSRFIPFHGAIWFLLFGVGLFCLARDVDPRTRRLRVLTTALGGIVLLLLINPGIAPIYPWAFRRYVVFLLPLMALVLGYGLTLPALQWRRFAPAGSIVTFLAAATLVVVGIRASSRAASVGDYVGFRKALATLNETIQDGDIVVADDARPGTPLLLMHGRSVLDGSRLWKSHDPEYQRKYLTMLRRLQVEQGLRILWLTSTKDALSLYPPAIGALTPLTAPLDVVYRTVVHHQKANRFITRENHSRFQWHLWQTPEYDDAQD